MSLFINTLSRLVTAFLPRSTHLLISSLLLPSAVILESKKIKPVTFHFFPIYLHEMMELDAMILVLRMLDFQASFSTLLFYLHQEAL